MKSSKQAKEKKKGGGGVALSGRLQTLHQRLHEALNLGTRVYDNEEWQWQCRDVEVQKHVLRAVSLFLDCISPDTAHHPLAKDSVAGTVGALVWILEQKNAGILSLATTVVVKLIATIPNSILQSYLICFVVPLSKFLCYSQLEVPISCATALNMILSRQSVVRLKGIWEILQEAKVVSHVVNNLRNFSYTTMPVEYFKEMATLLSVILLWRSSSRYSCWNDANLMEVLEVMRVNPDFSVKIAVLKLYCSIALCGNGAKKLLGAGENLLQLLVFCMGQSSPVALRMEGFRLAQCLAVNKQACLEMLSFCPKQLVKAVIDGMSGWTLESGKFTNEVMSLQLEACHLAQIVRWEGDHHDYFWKLEIGRVLLDLVLGNSWNEAFSNILSLGDQILTAQEGLKANRFLNLRPYIWLIIGWLAVHCREDFNPKTHGYDHQVDLLITCACLSFAESVQRARQVYQNYKDDTFISESASRAVLMMMKSPCNYIASKARLILSEILKSTDKEYPGHLLRAVNYTVGRDNIGSSDVLQVGVNLVILLCYCGLPQYQVRLVESGGVKAFISFVRWYMRNHAQVTYKRVHLQNTLIDRTCCWRQEEEWGVHALLFYGLWGVSELLYSVSLTRNLDTFVDACSEAQLVSTLQEICVNWSSPGLKWYAAHVLTYFGLYGFPCKLGLHIGKAFSENEYVDIQLILNEGGPINLHAAILAVRCPLFLPPKISSHLKNVTGGSPLEYSSENQHDKLQREVRLSSHVDKQALTKLLEFVYFGYLNAGEDILKKLKVLAKHCNLLPLLTMLQRRHPKWGIPYPSYNLSLAFSPFGIAFSDAILETKVSESICWACSFCTRSIPHIHAHKVVLWSRCYYMRALLQSGMKESQTQTIKVPVSWEATNILINWFYSDELPIPPSCCLWDNMGPAEKLQIVQPYVELCWLAGFWFMEEMRDISYKVVVSCMGSAKDLSIQLLQMAADLSLWDLAEAAANYLAPSYHQLCHSGGLEGLDETLIDMIRAASVLFSQEALRTDQS